jgi:hypothetical protein
VFTDCLGWAIGDYTPNVGEAGDSDEDKSVVNDLYSPVPPATSKSAVVSLVEEGSADMIPGVDSPAVVDLVSKPTGVDMGSLQGDPLKATLCLMMLSLIRHWMMVSKRIA